MVLATRLRPRVALTDNPQMRWDWVFLGVGVLIVVLVAMLLTRPIPGAPDPRRTDIAVDCSTGGGWVGSDGKTYCP
jgi:hypothetical protein